MSASTAPASGFKPIERASVLGAFHPSALLDPAEPAVSRRALLVELAPFCDEVSVGADGYYWRLKPDQRRQTLRRLHDEQRLGMLLHAAQPAEEGRFGAHLRAALQGVVPQGLPATPDDMDELREALQFAAVQVQAAQAGLASIDTQIARQERVKATRMLLPRRLVGRDDELQQLDAFLAGADGGTPVQMLSLTGVGGSGKSALLAAFGARTQGEKWLGTPVVVLDFDRALLADANGITLAAEVTRQLELFRPEWHPAFSRLRAELAEMALELSERGGSNDFDSLAALDSKLWSYWRNAFAELRPMPERILLVLDTFEEVLLRGDGETAYVLRWLLGLAVEGGLRGLRVLISGRAAPEAALVQQMQVAMQELVVGDLLPDAAQGLLADELERLGTAAPLALPLAALVQRFGGHPLLIKVLARYLHDKGAAAAAHDLLQNAEPGSTAFDLQFAQVFLYRRILGRIRSDDPAVEALAYPGLALRRVSADLIRRVLAKPCKLGPIDGAQAQALFERLRKQVWLVERSSDDSVLRHRRDLRRLMLPAMDADPALRVQRVHRRAAAYYRCVRDPLLTADQQRFEALYHALMGRLFARWPQLHDAKAFLVHLGQDAEQLPERAQARLKAEAALELTPQETSALGAPARALYEQRAEAQRRKRGRAAAAGAAAGVADAFAEGELDAVLALAPQAAEGFVTLLQNLFRVNGDDAPDFTGAPIWQVALAALALGHQRAVSQALRAVLDGATIDWQRPLRRRSQWGASCGLAVDMLQMLLGSPGLRRGAPLVQTEPVNSVENLRALALLAPAGRIVARQLRVQLGLLCYQSRDLLADIERGQERTRSVLERHREPIVPRDAAQLFGPLLMERATLKEYDLANLRVYTVATEAWPGETERRCIFCGCMPELYPAIRGTLGKVPDAVILGFVDGMSASRSWPFELQCAQLEGALQRDRARWLATLIESSDRAGALDALLAHAVDQAASPALARVQAMRGAYMRCLLGLRADPAALA